MHCIVDSFFLPLTCIIHRIENNNFDCKDISIRTSGAFRGVATERPHPPEHIHNRTPAFSNLIFEQNEKYSSFSFGIDSVRMLRSKLVATDNLYRR